MRHDVMKIDGEPVVLCFIAWMREYNGVTEDDTPIWDQHWAPGGYTSSAASKGRAYFLGEASNFTPARRKDGTVCAFGHVQANFDVAELGGIGDAAEKVTVIWCAADVRTDNSVRVVGWYRHATVYRTQEPFDGALHRSDRRLFRTHDGFNVVTEFKHAHLLDENERPLLERAPGNSERLRWHAKSKSWYGEGSPSLVPFLQKVLARDPSIIRPIITKHVRKPVTWDQVQQTVRARQGQSDFRKLLKTAYRSTCAISGCTTLALLDACHVYPASKADSYHGLENGLLLRTDLHTLFDVGLLAIDPKKKTVWVAPSVKDDDYRRFHGQEIATTQPGFSWPSVENLQWHWERRNIGL